MAIRAPSALATLADSASLEISLLARGLRGLGGLDLRSPCRVDGGTKCLAFSAAHCAITSSPVCVHRWQHRLAQSRPLGHDWVYSPGRARAEPARRRRARLLDSLPAPRGITAIGRPGCPRD